ncbi:hypothetical protein FCV25MIE_34115, partial [Fagus crenata]
ECIVGRGLGDKLASGANDLYGSWLKAPPRQRVVSSRNRDFPLAGVPLRSSCATPSGGSSRSSDSVPVEVFSFTANAKVVNNPIPQAPDFPKSMPGSQGGDSSRISGLDANGSKPFDFQVDDAVVGESQLFHAKTKGSGTSFACGDSACSLKKAAGSEFAGESGANVHATVTMPPVSTPGGTPTVEVKGKSTSPHLGTWKKRARAHAGMGVLSPSRGSRTGKRTLQIGEHDLNGLGTGSRSHKKHIKRVVVDSAVVVNPEQ